MNLKYIYDKISLEYDKRYVSDVHLTEDKIIKHILTSSINPNESILDIGCGTGHAISLGNLSVQNYLGIDFSKGMINDAKFKYPDYKFIVKDINKFGDNYKYDVLLAVYGQVNYLGLDKFCKILKKHGNKTYKFFSVLYAHKEHEDYSYTNEYQSYFTHNQILDAMKKNGIDCYVKGFSFNNTKATYENNLNLTLNKNLDDNNDCKYFILSNLNIFNGENK